MLSENLQSNFLGEFSKNLNLPSLEMHNKVNQVTSLLPCFLKQRSADLQVCKVWSVKKKKKVSAFWKQSSPIVRTRFDFYLLICFTLASSFLPLLP